MEEIRENMSPLKMPPRRQNVWLPRPNSLQGSGFNSCQWNLWKAQVHHGSCDQTKQKKKKKKRAGKNTIQSSNGSQLKFWQMFAMKRAFKKNSSPQNKS